ncbi:MAG: amidohydrolase family protein [Planctomycetota bacterium]|nr:amidohydrolase family protein [Planctomycetota bacterium]
MIISSLLISLTCSTAWQQAEEREPNGRAYAYRLDHIETMDGEALSNATVLVRDGIIERIGKAVVVPEHATIYDLRGTGAVMSPPIVLSHANFLQNDYRGSGNNSQFIAADSLWLGDSWAEDLWQHGVGMVAVDPPGSGAPGRTSVLKVLDSSRRPETLVDDLHLKINMASSSSAKKLVRGGFKSAEDAIENEIKAEKDWKKARKEWEEAQAEKAKQAEEAKANGEEVAEPKEGEEEQGPPETFEAPQIKPNVQPFVDWVRKERVAQIHMRSAGDWLHWRQLMEDREESYEVIFTFGSTTNIYEIMTDLVSSKVRVDLSAKMSYLPYTRNRINLPAEYLAAGGEKLVLSPSSNSLAGVAQFRNHISRLIAEGLDSAAALRAITLEPVIAIGQEEQMGKIAAGMPASFVIWSGDIFDPLTEVDNVVIDGVERFNREQFEQEEQR